MYLDFIKRADGDLWVRCYPDHQWDRTNNEIEALKLREYFPEEDVLLSESSTLTFRLRVPKDEK